MSKVSPKLTLKQKAALRKIEDLLQAQPFGVTLDDAYKETGLSMTVIKNALDKMPNVEKRGNEYFLVATPAVPAPGEELANEVTAPTVEQPVMQEGAENLQEDAENMQESAVSMQDGDLNTQAPQVSYPDNDQATLINTPAPSVNPSAETVNPSDTDDVEATSGFKPGRLVKYIGENFGSMNGNPILVKGNEYRVIASFSDGLKIENELSSEYSAEYTFVSLDNVVLVDRSSIGQATEATPVADDSEIVEEIVEVSQATVKRTHIMDEAKNAEHEKLIMPKKVRNKPFTPNPIMGYQVQKGKAKIFLDRRATSKTLTLSLDDLKELVNAVEKSERVA